MLSAFEECKMDDIAHKQMQPDRYGTPTASELAWYKRKYQEREDQEEADYRRFQANSDNH